MPCLFRPEGAQEAYHGVVFIEYSRPPFVRPNRTADLQEPIPSPGVPTFKAPQSGAFFDCMARSFATIHLQFPLAVVGQQVDLVGVPAASRNVVR